MSLETLLVPETLQLCRGWDIKSETEYIAYIKIYF